MVQEIQDKNLVGIYAGVDNLLALCDVDGKSFVINPENIYNSFNRILKLEKILLTEKRGTLEHAKAVVLFVLEKQNFEMEKQRFLEKITTEIANKYDGVICEKFKKNRENVRIIEKLEMMDFYKILKKKIDRLGKTYIEVEPYEQSVKQNHSFN
jgi:transposase